jgi:hypothetical protein
MTLDISEWQQQYQSYVGVTKYAGWGFWHISSWVMISSWDSHTCFCDWCGWEFGNATSAHRIALAGHPVKCLLLLSDFNQNMLFINLSRILQYQIYWTGFEVLMVAGIKMAVFWVIGPQSLVGVYWHFRSACCLHHLSHVEGSKYLWNVSKFLWDLTVLQPRRQPSSNLMNVHSVFLKLLHSTDWWTSWQWQVYLQLWCRCA